MPHDPRYDRLVHGSYLDRMILTQNVGWVRNLDGTYTVTWTQSGEPRIATFKSETNALRFAQMLDTTGTLPTEHDVREAEDALHEFERVTFGPETPSERRARLKTERSLAGLEAEMTAQEEEAAFESLRSLEPHVHRGANVPVRRHRRAQTFK